MPSITNVSLACTLSVQRRGCSVILCPRVLGPELVVERRDAGEKEIARRENEGQEEIVDPTARALSGLVPINRREEEEETEGRNKKVVKVVVSLSLSLHEISVAKTGRKDGKRKGAAQGRRSRWTLEGGKAPSALKFSRTMDVLCGLSVIHYL